jgi:DNA-binding helix-hairpin-helix protein with protein kinase domain
VVYDLVGRPNLVAKLYLGQASGDQAAKLAAMASATTGELSKLSAWPTGLVLDRGKAIGFLMPKISGFKPAFELYGPKLRLQKFPKADWRFLIRAATNTARVVAAIHDAGHVIGDINHGNMIVGQDATVRLIDCDSFQVSIGGRTWLCEVGVPTHQPPELQGISFNGLKRTPNHDAFGLAVLIFQMLCMARHPFSGKWLGAGEPPPIEDAIKTFCYAYSTDQAQTRMAPPPGSLPVNALGDPIKTLFEQAFSRAGVRPDGRPRAKKWIAALTNLEGALRQCSLVQSHYFLKTLPSCPWCRIERQTRTNLFPVTFVGSASGVDGFMVLWQQVEAIPMPSRGKLLAIPKPLKPSRAARKAGLLRKATAGGVAGYTATVWLASPRTSAIPSNPQLFAVLVGPALLLAFMVLLVIGRRFFREFKDYNKKWQSLSSRISSNKDASRAHEIKEQALKLKSDYDAAVSTKKSALGALHADRQNSQLIRYLDQFRVVGAGIPGIGAGKEAILQSYGIETAADVVERQIYQIPGFGHKTVQKLVAWRNNLAQSFRFNPNEPAAASDIAVIENAFAQKRRNLEKQLTSYLADIRGAVAAAVQYQDDVEREKTALEPEYALAIANKKAASLLF